jgi:peptidoglycan/LPS O-acetylase OafA/YrhL
MKIGEFSSGESTEKPSISQVSSGTLVSLQIGRGIAAFVVALFHAGALVEINCGYTPAHGVFAVGYAGVDFFFVLSGFIIFRRHIQDRGRPEKLADFGWRRVVRIYPVYWLVTLAVLPVHFLVPTYGKGDELTVHAIITSLILIPTQQAPILVVGWTLIHDLLSFSSLDRKAAGSKAPHASDVAGGQAPACRQRAAMIAVSEL